MGDRSELSRSLFALQILVFNFIGFFGNLNIIYATIKHKRLRTKHGTFLAQVAVMHNICLAFELVNAYLEWNSIPITRRQCFKLIQPYMLIICWQTSMYCVLTLNFLISVIWPIRHRVWETKSYCFVLNIPTIIYTVSMFLYARFHLDDYEILFCNPPLAFPPQIARVWSLSQLVFTLLAFIIFGLAYSTIRMREKQMRGSAHKRDREARDHRKGQVLSSSSDGHVPSSATPPNRGCRFAFYCSDDPATRDHRKFVRALLLLIVVSGLSWLCLDLMVQSAYYWTEDQIQRQYIQSYAVIFALICYSQHYYIVYFRSKLYRSAFQMQINALLCREVFHVEGLNLSSGTQRSSLPNQSPKRDLPKPENV